MKLSIILLFFLACQSSLSAQVSVNVEITNLRSDKGAVLIALYDNSGKFPRDAAKYAIGKVKAEITNKSAKAVFKDISNGRYAIAILHDENNNQKMDFNIIGMPREGYGFSNNAKGVLGPPGFKKAAFDLDAKRKTISIKMTYL